MGDNSPMFSSYELHMVDETRTIKWKRKLNRSLNKQNSIMIEITSNMIDVFDVFDFCSENCEKSWNYISYDSKSGTKVFGFESLYDSLLVKLRF